MKLLLTKAEDFWLALLNEYLIDVNIISFDLIHINFVIFFNLKFFYEIFSQSELSSEQFQVLKNKSE